MPRGRLLVTGASGFIGSAVTRALLADGCSVTAFVEPHADTRNLDGLDVSVVTGDLRDPAAVRRAMSGCRSVFHVAALYRFWAPDPTVFYDVNVNGTRNVLGAARECGVERVVYTSTVGTLGLRDRRPSNEQDYPDVGHLFGSYKRSKYVAEHEVLRAAAQGLPVVLVQPTMPMGPCDRAPTPSGRLVVEFLNGRMPGYVDTTLNVVHVDDVARGHVLAHDRGRVGRSYILGAENLPLQQVLAVLASLTGLPEPRLHVPRALSLAAAWLSDTIEGKMLRRDPTVPLEAARMSTTQMAFDDSRARTELGYAPRPAVEALADAARWYVDNGYVKAERSKRIQWRDDRGC
ncbi:MAG TPA: hopanoid-associated sugar epimerase [Jatrophihabitantaceae bacterium]|jgi:dihydroflavonol-4-reductase|nr:hopanoid-associated sugar epimerase [Jatrophihabitantaceae bacterium]